ncbi:MAG TPA: deoxyribodipyrimidine photo-lyase, partial [Actinomycetes bacterium]
LSDFDEVRKTDGDPFRVYSPFARAAKAAAWDDPLPAPSRVPVPEALGPGDPGRFDLDGAVEITPPDPAAALERLAWFVANRVDAYGRDRNLMAADGTSKLSPYLRFGLVSPRQVAAAVKAPGRRGGGRETFVNELLWRDFYAYVLYHRPESAWEHMRPEFAHFEFEDDPDGLAAWRDGRTGYPLVDAGMRQLTGQGWVHNRARMVVASFLAKHLLIDWREGARFFLQHLMDGDLASNNGGWQWVAGTGTDAAPYHRIFNPVTQAERFDPEGDYIRRFVPELARLPAPAIFAPWEAATTDLEAAGIRLGTDYPLPVVDHRHARDRALSRFQEATGRRR